MAYNDQENSIQDGAPYFLYEFNTTLATYRFTDYPENIDWNGETWYSFPIKHTEVKQSNELSKNSMTVTIPISGDFAALFLGWSPDALISYTLRRGHFGSADTLVYWKGRVSAHNLKDETIELKCESIFTSMRRAGIRARFQRNCRHALYASGCNVNKDLFAITGFIGSVATDGKTLTILSAATQVDSWFTGGILELQDGTFRYIINHSSDTIVINRPIRLISEGDWGYGKNYGGYYGGLSVILYPGCDRTLATCKNKFNNLLNNGSFKWIPQKNPMGGSSIV
jgi:phage-related protein